ncbi:hypothetical protein KR222_010820, partial [Zaprionus bogoriensis]
FLLTGPDLYNQLSTVLMNFREYPIVFIGDIKEMFLQIKVIPTDRFAQRILWREDTNSSPDVYQIQVLFFGAKCSPSIAQQVRNAQDEFPLASREIIDKHYMDDYLGGAQDIDSAVTLIKEVTEIHQRAGFEMCNWISNSKEVITKLNEDNNVSCKSKDLTKERVLGLMWDFERDIFEYNLKFSKTYNHIFDLTKRPTKRDVLKITMSIFDPLGFISHVLISSKILLQAI